jgi:hypothetical protein
MDVHFCTPPGPIAWGMNPPMPEVVLHRMRGNRRRFSGTCPMPSSTMRRGGEVDAFLREAIERSRPALPSMPRSEVHAGPRCALGAATERLPARCAVRWSCSTTSWPQRCCGSYATAGRSGATRSLRMYSIRHPPSGCTVSVHWRIIIGSSCRGLRRMPIAQTGALDQIRRR